MSQSIGDLLGAQLAQLRSELETEAASNREADTGNDAALPASRAAAGNAAAGAPGEGASTPADPIWEAVVEALSEATGVASSQIHPQWRLLEDGDLHPIARWAVVARVENELHVSGCDSRIEAASTAAQLADVWRS